MKILARNKGVLIFYVILLICAFVCTWRFERLEESNDETVNKVIFNIK